MPALRVVTYLRTSTDRQRDQQTIESQRVAIQRVIASDAYRFVQEYADDGISGTLILERPALQELLTDATKGRFDAVATCELSRLSRPSELADLAIIKRVFKAAGITVITPEKTYDFRNDTDDFISDILGAVAKLERRQLAARTARGKRRVALQARNPGGTAPYGYLWDRNARQFRVNAEEADVVRRIFDLVASVGRRPIADILEAEQVSTRRGGRWHGSMVRRILMNPIYTGRYAFNRFRWNPDKRSHRELPPDQWEYAEVPVEAIVTEEVFRRAAGASRERQSFSKRNTKTFYLLGGLLRCTCCGHVMTGEVCRTTKYYRPPGNYGGKDDKRCQNHWMRALEIEAVVWSVVAEFLKREQLWQHVLERNTSDMTELNRRVSSTERKIRENERATKRAHLLLVKNILGKAGYDAAMAELTSERTMLDVAFNDLTRELNSHGQHADRALEDLRDWQTDDLTDEQRRDILRSLCGGANGSGVWLTPDGAIEVRGVLSF